MATEGYPDKKVARLASRGRGKTFASRAVRPKGGIQNKLSNRPITTGNLADFCRHCVNIAIHVLHILILFRIGVDVPQLLEDLNPWSGLVGAHEFVMMGPETHGETFN